MQARKSIFSIYSLLPQINMSPFTDDVYSREATSQARACSHLATAARVKYPAPWGGLVKKKLGHAPIACCGVFDLTITPCYPSFSNVPASGCVSVFALTEYDTPKKKYKICRQTTTAFQRNSVLQGFDGYAPCSTV